MAGFFDNVGSFFGGLFSGNKSDQQDQQRRANAATFKAVNSGSTFNSNPNNSLNTSNQFKFGSFGTTAPFSKDAGLADEMERRRKEEEERKRREEEQRKTEEARKAREAAAQAQRDKQYDEWVKAGNLNRWGSQMKQAQQNNDKAWQDRLQKLQPTNKTFDFGQAFIEADSGAEQQGIRNAAKQIIADNKWQTEEDRARLNSAKRFMAGNDIVNKADKRNVFEKAGEVASDFAIGTVDMAKDATASVVNAVKNPGVGTALMNYPSIASIMTNPFIPDDQKQMYKSMVDAQIAKEVRDGEAEVARQENEIKAANYAFQNKLIDKDTLERIQKNNPQANANMNTFVDDIFNNNVVRDKNGNIKGATKITDEGIVPITDVREARDQGTGGAVNAGLTALQFMPFNPSSTAKTVGGRVLSNLGQGALINTALEGSMIASEAGMGKELTPEEIATRLATSSLLGGVMEGAGGIGRAGGKVASNTAQTLRDTGRDIISKNGPMGREYTQFSDGTRSTQAADYIDRRGQGVAREAIRSSDNINYDLPYGRANTETQKGYGLSHIRDDHAGGMGNVHDTIRAIEDGERNLGDEWKTRAAYDLDDQRAVAADNFNDNTNYKPILTGYKETDLPAGTNPTDSAPRSVNTPSVPNNTTNVNSKVEVIAEAPNGAQVVRETAPSGAQREYIVNTDVDEAAQMQAQRQAVKLAEDEENLVEEINGGVTRPGVVLGVKTTSNADTAIPANPQGIVTGVKTSRTIDNIQNNSNFTDTARAATETQEYLPMVNKDLIANAEARIANEGLSNSATRVTDTLSKNPRVNNKQYGEALVTLRELGQMNDDISARQFNLLAQEVAKHSRSNAQQLQFNRIMQNQTPEGMRKNAVNNLADNGVEVTPEISQTVKNMTDDIQSKRDTADAIRTEIDNTADLNTVKELGKQLREANYQTDLATAGFGKYVGELLPSKKGDIISSLYRASLLSSIRTQTKNMTSNVLNLTTRAAAELPSKLVDTVISKFTGNKTISPTLRGAGEGFAVGVNRAKQYLKTGIDELNASDVAIEGRGRGELKLNNKVANAVFGKPTNLVYRVVGAGDKPIRYASEINGLYKVANIDAANSGLTGAARQDFITRTVVNPTEKQMQRAIMEGSESVFAADNAISKVINQLRAPQVVKTLIMPFVKVPTNIFFRQFDYTPAGAIKSVVNLVRDIKKNGGLSPEGQRNFARDLSKSTLGTASLFTLGQALAAEGMYYGDYPDDPNERKRWEAEGIKENSIKIGDNYIQVGGLSVLGMPIAMGARFRQNVDAGGDVMSSAGDSMMNSIKVIGDLPMAQGAKEVSDALFGSGYDNSAEGITNKATQFVIGKLTGFVPNLLNTVATSTDALERDAATDDIIGQVVKRLPGLRTLLPAKIDSYGREVKNGSFITGIFDPLYTSAAKDGNDPVILEVNRLAENVDKQNLPDGMQMEDLFVTPTFSIPSNVKDENGNEAKLSTEQRNNLERQLGEATHNAWSQIMQTDSYKNSDVKTQVEMLKDAKTQATSGITKNFEQQILAGQNPAAVTGENSNGYQAREWYNLSDGKIKRYDGATASYGGDISGLTRDQQNLLSMTQSELERDAENNKWDTQALWYEAEAAALKRQLEAVQQGYNNGQNSKQDIAAIEGQIAKANENKTVSSVNQRFQNDAGVNQALVEMGTSTYDIAQLYDDISVTEWRNMENGPLKELLAIYDSARTADKVSGKNGDKTSNKYYYKGNGKKASLGPDIITPTLKTPTINAPTFDSNTKKGKGIVKGLTTRKLNTEAKVTALPRVAIR